MEYKRVPKYLHQMDPKFKLMKEKLAYKSGNFVPTLSFEILTKYP